MDQSHIAVCRHYFQVMYRRTRNRQQINNLSGSFAKSVIKYDNNYRQLLDYHNTSARERLRNCGKRINNGPRSGIAEGRFETGDTCAVRRRCGSWTARYAAYFNRDNSGQTSQFVILLLVLP